jgi:hypothetical protein
LIKEIADFIFLRREVKVMGAIGRDKFIPEIVLTFFPGFYVSRKL